MRLHLDSCLINHNTTSVVIIFSSLLLWLMLWLCNPCCKYVCLSHLCVTTTGGPSCSVRNWCLRYMLLEGDFQYPAPIVSLRVSLTHNWIPNMIVCCWVDREVDYCFHFFPTISNSSHTPWASPSMRLSVMVDGAIFNSSQQLIVVYVCNFPRTFLRN